MHLHGLPDEDREFSLEGEAIKRKVNADIRQCKACGAVFSPRPKCPMCGYVAPPPALPDVVDEPLQRIGGTRDAKERTYLRVEIQPGQTMIATLDSRLTVV